MFIGQSLHWCTSPRVRLSRIKAGVRARVRQRQRDSQAKWARTRGMKWVRGESHWGHCQEYFPSLLSEEKERFKHSHLIASTWNETFLILRIIKSKLRKALGSVKWSFMGKKIKNLKYEKRTTHMWAHDVIVGEYTVWTEILDSAL